MFRNLLVVLGLFTASVAVAQDLTGVISGIVTEQTGAAVPGAAVTILNVDTNMRVWNGITNGEGFYSASSLPVGIYNVMVVARGFAAYAVNRFELQVDQRARVDAVLRVGGVSEAITVSGDQVSVLQTETSSMSVSVNPSEVANLPLGGRDPLNLVFLSGGLSAGGDATAINQSQISINGGRSQANEVNVDGVSVLDGTTNSIGHLPSVEAVQEMKILTSAYSSEYGRSGGAVLALVVKSGTNQYHGGIYDYLRNEDLNANDFFSNLRGAKRPVYRQNQYGATLGGPVLLPRVYKGKDRTFFFFSYAGTRSVSPTSPIATIPSLAFRTGNFSSSPVVVDDPSTHAPFASNIIPTTRLDPAGQKIMAALPAPNSPGTLAASTGQAANDFVNSTSTNPTSIDVTSRVDHAFNDRQRIFARLTWYTAWSPSASILPGLMDPGGNWARSGQWSSALGYTHVLTPSLILDFRLGIFRKTKLTEPNQFGQSGASALGIQRATIPVVPEITVTGWTDLGYQSGQSTFTAENIFQLSPSITWTKGGHSIKAGVQTRRDDENAFTANEGYGGQYYFTGGITSTNLATGNAINSLAELLLGAVRNTSYVLPQPITGRRNLNLAFFMQDDWKVTRKLTLNLGLRNDYESPLTSSNGMYSGIDVNTGKLLVANQNASASLNFTTPKINLGPRVGFAYSLDPKTVIRSAFGMFYAQVESSLGGSIGFPGYTLTQTNGSIGTGLAQPFPLSLGIPVTITQTYNPFAVEKAATTSNPLAGDKQFGDVSHVPTNLQWNYGIQRQVGRATVVEANYVGSHAYHLPLFLNFNTLPSFQVANIEEATGSAVSTQQYRKFPTVASNKAAYDVGSSSYHSLQLQVRRQYSRSVSLLASYTFSKAMDDGSGQFTNTQPTGAVDQGQLPQLARYLDRAVSAFDRRNVFTISGQYTSNFGPKWLRNFIVAPVFTARSGFPVTITQTNEYPDMIQQRPNINGPISALYAPQLLTRGTGIQYFRAATDPSFPLTPTGPVFSTVNGKTQIIIPASLGNLSRFPVRAPGDLNLNLGIGKRFPIRERLSLQLRAEAFNAFNHVNFGLPSVAALAVVANGSTAAFNSPGFGLITSTESSRFMQLVARIEF